ncbi:MAG: broad specificity phosphatase PhoE [Psychromonas sp.]|jgi:broad specificity phosphatase PhoE|uniref:hypothetical protein n=1 Tax=Psychromonas sp. TaxID=1884585 RepID=UPI0039E321DB
MEILLIRHGKPTGAINPRLSASGFAYWVRNYNRSKVDPRSLPPKDLSGSLGSHFIVASDLARSVDSVYMCLNREPDLKLKQLREMNIPCYKLPFVFKAYTWLIISRIFWLAGFSGKVESFKAAKIRARISAKQLQELAIKHEKVAFFGHGMLNKYIAKELNKLGWDSSPQGEKYWSTIKLKI